MKKLIVLAILLATTSAFAERRVLEPPLYDLDAPKMVWKPSLASAGDTFLAVWAVETRSGYELQPAVHYAAVDANGIRISPIRIDEGELLGTTIATNGNEFLFLRLHDQRLIATRVGRGGEKIADVVLQTIPSPGSTRFWADMNLQIASVVWTGDGYLAVWTDDVGGVYLKEVHSAFIRADGTATPARLLALPALPAERGWNNPPYLYRWRSGLALDWNGSVALLVLTETLGLPTGSADVPFSTATTATRLTATGDLIDDASLEFGPRSSRGQIGFALIATNGVDFLVSWFNPHIAGAELLSVQADRQQISLGWRQLGVNGLTWTGKHYLLSKTIGSYLYIRPAAPDGTEVGETLVLRASGRVDANDSGQILILSLEEEGVVTYSQDDLTPAPLRRRAARH